MSCQGSSQVTDFASLAFALARFGKVGREATNQKVGSSSPPGRTTSLLSENKPLPSFLSLRCVPVFLHTHCTHARDGPFFPHKIHEKIASGSTRTRAIGDRRDKASCRI